jgi:hypothetical protein
MAFTVGGDRSSPSWGRTQAVLCSHFTIPTKHGRVLVICHCYRHDDDVIRITPPEKPIATRSAVSTVATMKEHYDFSKSVRNPYLSDEVGLRGHGDEREQLSQVADPLTGVLLITSLAIDQDGAHANHCASLDVPTQVVPDEDVV